MKLGKNFKKFNGSPRNVLIFLLFFVVSLVVLTRLTDYSRTTESLTYSQFLDQVATDAVQKVRIAGTQVVGLYKSGQRFEAVIAENPQNIDLLRKHSVEIIIEDTANSFNMWYLFTLLLIGGGVLLAWFLVRQSRGSGGGSSGIFSMGKSNARLFLPSQIKITFKDVAGAQEAKDELKDIVDFLKNPEKYRKIGAQLTRGVLLVGEPGNGKTLLAKAVAGEANCPFFSITGSDFIEVFVGVGAARIRDLFAQARKKSPCIIFIDEIDAIGRRRGSGLGGGNDEREQTLNQLLTEMDGFASSDVPVVVIAATNIPGVLDRALLRPGRFDRRITVPYPDEAARLQLLEINARKVKMAADVDFEKIVQASAGLSGADLANCVNLAAINASKKRRALVTQEDFDEAFRKLSESQRSTRNDEGTSGENASSARMYMPSQMKVRFADVAGLEEAKEEVQDLVDYLKNPSKYTSIGAKVPRGILLVGDPGNGKTLLARAVAGESGRPFFSASGSEFIEKYVGVGAARVRDLFAQARRHAPSIIFIDEIDSIGGRRDTEHAESGQTLNQLLTEMDGFENDRAPVIVLAATNRVDILDKALTRAGRFDRQVDVPYPDIKGRREVLEVHAKNIKIDETISLEKIARGTSGFSAADLANLVNEAAIHAVKSHRSVTTIDDFEEARDKILMGKKSKSKTQSVEDLRATAYHEAGHALAIVLQPNSPVVLHKVTIVPRGQALGFASYLPEREQYGYSKEEIESKIITSLAGRVGEELGTGKQFSGVTSDLKNVTDWARRMVCHYGMSEKLGLVAYDASGRSYSTETATKIDEEIKAIAERCYQRTVQLLRENRDKLEFLTQKLLEKETLQAEEVYELLGITPKTIHKLS